MKLYYAPGACSLAAHIALQRIRTALRSRSASTCATHRTADDRDYYAINPKGYVPLLELDDGDAPDRSRGDPPVHRRSPARHARPGVRLDRALPADGMAEFHRHRDCTRASRRCGSRRRPTRTRRSASRRSASASTTSCKRSARKPYLTGDTFTIADAYLFTIVNWQKFLKFDLDRWPALQQFQRARRRASERAPALRGRAPAETGGVNSRYGTSAHAVPVARLADARRSRRASSATRGRRSAQRLAAAGRDLIASAHWETSTADGDRQSRRPETIHDFGGFPKALYEIRYPAPGAPELAARVVALLKDAGITAASTVAAASITAHGCRCAGCIRMPDIPVVQLAVQPARGTAHHLALGRALAPLRSEDVLIIGSGHATHNLRDWAGHRGNRRRCPTRWSFRRWLDAQARRARRARARRLPRSRAGRRARASDRRAFPAAVRRLRRGRPRCNRRARCRRIRKRRVVARFVPVRRISAALPRKRSNERVASRNRAEYSRCLSTVANIYNS